MAPSVRRVQPLRHGDQHGNNGRHGDTYAYDGSDHLTKVVAGDLGTTTLAYDSSGFLTSIAEPGRTVALSQSDGAVSRPHAPYRWR